MFWIKRPDMSVCVTINDWQFKTWHKQTERDCKLRCWCYHFIENNIGKVTPNFGTIWVSFEQMTCIFFESKWCHVLFCIFGNYMLLSVWQQNQLTVSQLLFLFWLICNFQADYEFWDNLSKVWANDGQIHLIIIVI